MADLTTDVRYIKGIGEARARNLKKLGIETLGDLINYFPRAYADRREFTSISNAIPGETVCICAMVASEPKLSRIRKGLELVKVRVVDDSAAMDITFFNQSYLKNSLRPGESYVFCGKMEGTLLKKQMTNPQILSRCFTCSSSWSRTLPSVPSPAGRARTGRNTPQTKAEDSPGTSTAGQAGRPCRSAKSRMRAIRSLSSGVPIRRAARRRRYETAYRVSRSTAPAV